MEISSNKELLFAQIQMMFEDELKRGKWFFEMTTTDDFGWTYRVWRFLKDGKPIDRPKVYDSEVKIECHKYNTFGWLKRRILK